jgi:hypothetical protein
LAAKALKAFFFSLARKLPTLGLFFSDKRVRVIVC